MTKKMKLYSKTYIGFVFAFLYLPILVLIVNSFNSGKGYGVFSGVTLKWYGELFHNRMILSAIGVTLLIAAISAVVSTLIGTSAAVGIHSMKRGPRMLIKNVTYVPIVNPEIVTGVSLMLLFVVFRSFAHNFTMGFSTLVVAHITFNIPYVIFSVTPKLRQMDKNLYEAALDLGCSPRQAFFKVVLPEIMPGIGTGFLMALTYSIDDFVISYFTAGTVQTLPISIYSMTRRQVSPQIYALSTLLFVVVLAILLIMNIGDIRRENKLAKERRL